jgi:hypothetical protein
MGLEHGSSGREPAQQAKGPKSVTGTIKETDLPCIQAYATCCGSQKRKR